MTLEEIVGLEGVRRKFEELKNMVSENVRRLEEEILEDVRLKFDLMSSKLREKIINVELREVSV
jgi:hypothetical protein